MRVDSGVEEGGEVVGLYDPMIAKLLVWDSDQRRAIARMRRALDEFEIEGVQALLPLHRLIFARPEFVAGETCAGLVEGELAAQLTPAEPATAPRPGCARTHGRAWSFDGRRHTVPVLDAAADVLAGERRRRSERRARGRGGSTGSEAISSPMQGTVLRVEVREGEPVETGRVLVIVEAMKMENEIAADRRGIVADVRVAPGDSVRSGQVLLSVVDAA